MSFPRWVNVLLFTLSLVFLYTSVAAAQPLHAVMWIAFAAVQLFIYHLKG